MRRGGLREVARIAAVPLLAIGAFAFVVAGPRGRRPAEVGPPPEPMERINLVQKDTDFQLIPPERGGATGAVWYTPEGPVLPLQLRGHGLVPRRAYLVELMVDETVYAIGSWRTGVLGRLFVDTTLTRFAEGVCVGEAYDPPRPLAGPHEIRFWVKADGNPRSGTLGRPEQGPVAWREMWEAMRGTAERGKIAEGAASGRDLPCSGNGDGDYAYALLENEVARFTGTEPAPGSGRRGAPDAELPEVEPAQAPAADAAEADPLESRLADPVAPP